MYARRKRVDMIPQPKQYYPALDGLRAVAVTMVFFAHYEMPGLRLDRIGWMGVDIFFVLSGFLITGILFDSRQQPHRFRDFYMRRILRIFPLYYGVWLLLLLPAMLYMHGRWSERMWLWPMHLGNYLAATPNHPASPFPGFPGTQWVGQLVPTRPVRYIFRGIPIGHFWSLCVEEQFYLLWPAVVYSRLRRSSLLSICAAGAFVVLLLRVGVLLMVPRPFQLENHLYFLTPLRVDSFLIGGGLALLLRGPQKAWLHANRKSLCLPVYAATTVFAVWCMTFRDPTQVQTHPFTFTVGSTLMALFSAAAILHATNPDTLLYSMLSVRPLRALGSISYGFYILHWLPFLLFTAIAVRIAGAGAALPYLRALVAYPATIAFAAISYTWYEQPFLRLKNRFGQQVHRTPIA